MPRRAGPDRVLGPYPAGRGYRLVIIRAGEKSPTEVYPTEQEAKQVRRAIEREMLIASRTYSEAMKEYRLYKAEKGNKARSIETDVARAMRFFAGWEDRPIAPPTEAQASKMYAALRERPTHYGRPPSASDQQNCLKAARRFGAWLVRTKRWKTNPLTTVEMMGKANRGKVQLSRDQGRMWLSGALAAHDTGDDVALAAVVCLMLGVRASEIASRRVSHLDDGGEYLRITESKSDNGIRGLPILDLDVVAALKEQAKRARAWGRAQEVAHIDPPLFPPIAYMGERRKVYGEHISVSTVRRAVRRVCRAVGLPLITTHALRGTFSSRAAARGVAIAAVAADLGNNPLMAARHYATEQSQATGRAVESFQIRSTCGENVT